MQVSTYFLLSHYCHHLLWLNGYLCNATPRHVEYHPTTATTTPTSTAASTATQTVVSTPTVTNQETATSTQTTTPITTASISAFTTATSTAVTEATTTATPTAAKAIAAQERLEIRYSPSTVYLGQQFDMMVSYQTIAQDTSLFVALTLESKWFGGLQIPLKQGQGTMLVSGIKPQNGAAPGLNYQIDAFTTAGFVAHNQDINGYLAADSVENIRLASSKKSHNSNLSFTSTVVSNAVTSPSGISLETVCTDLQDGWKDTTGATCADHGALGGGCNTSAGTMGLADSLVMNSMNRGALESPGTVCCVCGGGEHQVVDPLSTDFAIRNPASPLGSASKCNGGLSEFGKQQVGRGTISRVGLLASVKQVQTKERCSNLCLQFGSHTECNAFQYHSDNAQCELLAHTSSSHFIAEANWILYDRTFDCHATTVCKSGPTSNFIPPIQVGDETTIPFLTSAGALFAPTTEACATKCIDRGLECRGYVFEPTTMTCQLQISTAAKSTAAKNCASLKWPFPYKHPHVCGISPLPCATKSNFEEAEQLCHSHGGRLCTVTELKDDAARGTGCGADKALLWTSDSCSVEDRAGHLVALGRSSRGSQQSPECKEHAYSAVKVRCCSDTVLQTVGMFYRRSDNCQEPEQQAVTTTASFAASATPKGSAVTTYCGDCVRQYSPVCGIDHKVYFNPCFAECNNVHIYSSGYCKPRNDDAACPVCSTTEYSPVCANGVTYYNKCFSLCQNITKFEPGFCSLEAVHQNLRDESKSRTPCAELGHMPQNPGRFPKTCAFTKLFGKCYGGETWNYADAQAVCQSAGARLCTVAELNSDVATGTGCEADLDYVWTGEACGSGVYVTAGSSTAQPQRDTMCASKETKIASVRCCADVFGDSNLLSIGETRPHTSRTSSQTTTTTVQSTTTTVTTTITTTLSQPKSYCHQVGLRPQNPDFPDVCAFSQINGFCFNQERYPLQAADYLCKSVNARLCTANELLQDVAQGTGCEIDEEYVWSGEKCTLGNLVMAGSVAALQEKPTRCVSPDSKASIRCCSHFSAAATTSSPATTTGLKALRATTIQQDAVEDKELNECHCSSNDKPACAYKDADGNHVRVEYGNVCKAKCAKVTRFKKGKCPALTTDTESHEPYPIECTTTSSKSMNSYSIITGKRVQRTAKYTIGERKTMPKVRDCTQACIDFGHTCKAVEWHGKNKWCELKTTGASAGTVKNNRWKLYERKSFC